MKKYLALLTIVGVMALIFVVGYFIGCPIRVITGIPCPGCGMTRAFASLLHLDFARAFHYHPLFPLIIITALAFIACVLWYAHANNKNALNIDGRDLHLMMDNLFSRKITVVYLCIFIVAFVVVYLIRFPNIP